jgi:peptide/nickel transport system permease protein
MNARLRFVATRIGLTIPVLLLMSVFVFMMIHLVPGDPVRTMLGFRATDANVKQVTQSLGLDEPLIQQYLDWLGGLLHGDLGQDYISHESLSHLLGQALPVTLELTMVAMGLAVVIGVPLGVQAATGPGWVRRLTEGFVVAGISIPDFWLGIMLVLVFTATLGVLPPSGYVPFLDDPVQNLRYMLLPVLTLAVGETAYILRTTRGAMEQVLDRPFITYLRAKGIRHFPLMFKHALRNASVPIATVIGIQFGVLLGGAIVIETLFALPGVGRLVVTAINQRNYPVVQAGVLAIAALFLLVNLLTDLVIGWLDPRIADGARQ